MLLLTLAIYLLHNVSSYSEARRYRFFMLNGRLFCCCHAACVWIHLCLAFVHVLLPHSTSSCMIHQRVNARAQVFVARFYYCVIEFQQGHVH